MSRPQNIPLCADIHKHQFVQGDAENHKGRRAACASDIALANKSSHQFVNTWQNFSLPQSCFVRKNSVKVM